MPSWTSFNKYKALSEAEATDELFAIVQEKCSTTGSFSSRTPQEKKRLRAANAKVRKLIRAGAYVHATKLGITPLHYAAQFQLSEVVTTLIENSADVHARDTNGLTPLHYALLSGHPFGVVGVLLKRGADVFAKTRTGNNVLHYAVTSKYPKDLSMVIDAMLKVPGLENEHNGRRYLNIPNDEGDTALHCAASNNVLNAVEQLLESGADSNALNNKGHTPLHTFATKSLVTVYGCAKIDRTLLKYPQIKVNTVDSDGRTPLHVAARSRAVNILIMLLARPEIGVNTIDSKGRTPLHEIIRHSVDNVYNQRVYNQRFINAAAALFNKGARVAGKNMASLDMRDLGVEDLRKLAEHPQSPLKDLPMLNMLPTDRPLDTLPARQKRGLILVTVEQLELLKKLPEHKKPLLTREKVKEAIDNYVGITSKKGRTEPVDMTGLSLNKLASYAKTPGKLLKGVPVLNIEETSEEELAALPDEEKGRYMLVTAAQFALLGKLPAPHKPALTPEEIKKVMDRANENDIQVTGKKRIADFTEKDVFSHIPRLYATAIEMAEESDMMADAAHKLREAFPSFSLGLYKQAQSFIEGGKDSSMATIARLRLINAFASRGPECLAAMLPRCVLSHISDMASKVPGAGRKAFFEAPPGERNIHLIARNMLDGRERKIFDGLFEKRKARPAQDQVRQERAV